MKKVMFWDDERNIGNSLIVTLKRGWKFSDDPMSNEHVRGFDTVTEAKKEIKSAIKCLCADCQKR